MADNEGENIMISPPDLPHPHSALTRLVAPSPFEWRGGEPSEARLGVR